MHEQSVREYLEERLTLEGDKGWTRRDPRTTHPEILEAVRRFQASGGRYDADAEAFVSEQLGELPGPELRQLGHECYIAKTILRDEERAAELEELRAQGFRLLGEELELEEGKRYTVRVGTVYCGQEVPAFSAPFRVSGKAKPGGGVGPVRKGCRTFVYVSRPALVLEGWAPA
jgi:hypothetical protein